MIPLALGHLDFLQLWNRLFLQVSLCLSLFKLWSLPSLFTFASPGGAGSPGLPVVRLLALNSQIIRPARPFVPSLKLPELTSALLLFRDLLQLTWLNMAEGGEYHAPNTAANGNGDAAAHPTRRPSDEQPPLEQVESILRSRANTPNPFSRQHTSLDLDDYFVSHPPTGAAWRAVGGATSRSIRAAGTQ